MKTQTTQGSKVQPANNGFEVVAVQLIRNEGVRFGWNRNARTPPSGWTQFYALLRGRVCVHSVVSPVFVTQNFHFVVSANRTKSDKTLEGGLCSKPSTR